MGLPYQMALSGASHCCLRASVAILEIESIEIAQIGNQSNKRLLILAIRAISALADPVTSAYVRQTETNLTARIQGRTLS